MITRNQLAPGRLLALFAGLAGIPLAALGWLGWQVIAQDRALESQRARERLENSATLLAREIDRALAAWDDLLLGDATKIAAVLPPGAVFLAFDGSGVLDHRGASLPYHPVVPAAPTLPGGVFESAEALEFRQGNLASAASAYLQISRTSNRSLRGEALMRLARCLRKQERSPDALGVYGDLRALAETPVAGSPAALVAHGERLTLFRALGDKDGAEREATALATALHSGRFRIDRATFDFYSALAPAPDTAASALALADAVQELWPRLQQQAEGRAAAAGEGGAVAAVWRRTSTGSAAVIGEIDTLLASMGTVMESLDVRLALQDSSGRAIWGAVPAGTELLVRTFRETGLPWTMRIATSDPAGAGEAAARRRNLLSAAFVMMVLVIATATYFTFRAVNRELGVARLQADFVAAVSHEFRTPLTAMRHLTDMLEEGGAETDRLPRYYGALGRETRRLHTLVESLLDFGRMEAGRRTYQMQDTSAGDLAREVVDDFREHASFAPGRVELHATTGPRDDEQGGDTRIRADRAAISLALRNLLDNAVKYSSDSSTVSVSVETRGELTGISVEDHGVGITKQEQRDVFRKFVRGSAAQTMNVKGTGIGLAMADQIVRAHGGHLELSSEAGRGSRFTIWLPAV